MYIAPVLGGVARTHQFPVEFEGTTGGFDISAAGQDTRLYADPGSTVDAFVERTAGTGNAFATVSISGYLVDA